MSRARVVFLLSIAFLSAHLFGCGAAQDSDSDLKFFALTYGNYIQVYQREPSSWDEFLELSKAPGLEEDLAMLEAVKQSGYQVVWDAGISGDSILAFPKDAANAGGRILFGDGSLRQMSAEEFSKAKESK